VLIVGDDDDPHVSAVRAALPNDTLVLDAALLSEARYAVSGVALLERMDGEWHPVRLGQRGWIRRLAPEGWLDGLMIGSLDAARRGAWLAAIAALIRAAPVQWLTDLDRLYGSESKLIQSLVLPWSPESVIAPTPEVAAHILGTSDLVAKPIGPTHFRMAGSTYAMPTSAVRASDCADVQPDAMLYQRKINAIRHLRLVTVGDTSFCYAQRVDSELADLDWRFDGEAASHFVPCREPELEHRAVEAASMMSVRFSSQDWIDDGSESHLIDLNPAGQWLFLPDSERITQSLAEWLKESS